MQLSLVLTFAGLGLSLAWSPVVNSQSKHTVALNMASRAAQKKKSRQMWAEAYDKKRGTGSSTGDIFTVIGGGRIGSLLSQGDNSLLLKRGGKISEDGNGPIVIATRNDALDSIIDDCPQNRLKDLVFVQNGYLDKYLTSKGLADNTQVLLFLSVPSLGVDPVDGVTSVNPEGLTAATGIHAQAFADKLKSLELKCNVIDSEEYKNGMFEKLIWISTYMLVGTAKECSSVGQAGLDHKKLVETVINELSAAVSAKEGLAFEAGIIERLSAYTDVVTDFPCAVKEFEWRNEYFYGLGDEACPTHNELLRECKKKGVIVFDLP